MRRIVATRSLMMMIKKKKPTKSSSGIYLPNMLQKRRMSMLPDTGNQSPKETRVDGNCVDPSDKNEIPSRIRSLSFDNRSPMLPPRIHSSPSLSSLSTSSSTLTTPPSRLLSPAKHTTLSNSAQNESQNRPLLPQRSTSPLGGRPLPSFPVARDEVKLSVNKVPSKSLSIPAHLSLPRTEHQLPIPQRRLPLPPSKTHPHSSTTNPPIALSALPERPPSTAGPRGLCQARVLFDFVADLSAHQINLSRGDLVVVTEKDEGKGDGWWYGQCNDHVGYFPASFVELL